MSGSKFFVMVHLLFLVCIMTWAGSDGNSLFGQEARAASESLSTAQSEQQEAKELPPAQHYTVTRATSAVKVDGVLDEDAWANAVVIKILYEYLPGDNIPAPVETDCLVTYDNNSLYVAFRAFDPNPREIRAHLMDRDAMDTFIQDDHVTILIDSFNDERRAFQFRVNPLGVQADANFSELEGYEDFSWDAIWDSAGQITDEGYVVEIAIPFNQLRFPRSTGAQTWGFSAERSYPRSVRHRIQSHVRDRNISCFLCQANKLAGFEGITPGRNLEFDPTLTSSRTDIRSDFPQGGMEAGKAEVEPGITARWGITPNLMLNATGNPDFSQVEADIAQLDVNVRFALYYPEKRPFFLEGADFFLTPLNAVFTRTVADPVAGLKLTGKVGKNALGVFTAHDRINNLIFPANQTSQFTSLDQGVTSGVFRYRRDVGRASTLGVLYAGRTGEDYYNQVFGFDGFIRLSNTKTVSFQYLHSETDYPQDVALSYGQSLEPFGGDALVTSFLHVSRNWWVDANYRDIASDFRADYGFIPRVDIRNANGSVGRRFWGKPDGWYNYIEFGIYGSRTQDHQGTLTDQTIALRASYNGPLQSFLLFNVSRNKEFFNGVTYDLNRLQFISEIKPTGAVWLRLFGQIGDSIDYVNSRAGDFLYLRPSVEFKLGRHLNINLRHDLERLSTTGDEIYQANLTQANLVYNFNVRTFVRAILQYRDVVRDPNLYIFPVEPKSNTLFTQFLFSYKINPQTVLFLGYSDNYLGLHRIDLTRTDRTFFIKIGYAWVL